MIDSKILGKLNVDGMENRLSALKEELACANFPTQDRRYINNHIHTCYSFSPYSPTAAVYAARAEGLVTAGIMDHDSIAGANEFILAGEIMDFPVTVGMECRVRMDGTPFEKRRTNNPDQVGVSYMAIHGVPHENIDRLQSAFEKRRELRNDRNRLMVSNINTLLGEYGINLDFDSDVLPLSMYKDGGSVTERHLMLALAKAIISKANGDVPTFLEKIGVLLSPKQKAQLTDKTNPHSEYDLLGILKGAFVPKIYVDATTECPTLDEAVALATDVGGVLCYAYLGDVSDSVTGDKKAQKFEDDHLEELLNVLKSHGVRAVTYMPTRNTSEQLTLLRSLCDKNGLFQISGEDINSPRQSFVIRAMEREEFANLIDSTWAIIDHEQGVKKLY